MYLSATNQGPTATINSAMSGRVGGGRLQIHIHMGDTYCGGAEYTQNKNNKTKKTIVSERRSSEKIAFTDMI